MSDPVSTPVLRGGRLRWWVLAALSAAQLLLVLDSTVMNVALPTTQADLGFTDAERPWVITAYALTFGSLLLVGGRLADSVGRKRLLLVSLAGFIIASLIGGFATGFSMLVIARTLQGISGALMAPATLSSLATAFADTPGRGKAFGIFGAVSSSGSAVGLILSGFLTEYLDWRWCLLINVVIGFTIAALVIKLLPQDDARSRHPARPDVLGALTSVLGVLAIVYGCTIAESRSWTDPLTIGAIVGGLLLLALFTLIETRVPRPVLPMHVVLDRNRGGAYLMVTIGGIGMFGVFLFLTYYVQNVLGFAPLATGLAFLPMVLMLVIGAIVAGGALLPRMGARALAVTGLAVAAAGAASFTAIDASSTYPLGILPGLVVTGAGFGLVFGPAMNLATLGVAPEDSGAASAMVNAAQQIGAAFGTAVLNPIAVSATAAHLAPHPETVDAAAASLIHGNTVAFWTTSAILLVGALACGLLIEPGRGADAAHSADDTAESAPIA
ncbi:MAG: MFS transporter [Kocuria sp.]|nr:MFS transporter [Kocuria sp.]